MCPAYANADPINAFDPTGYDTLASVGTAMAMGAGLGGTLGAIDAALGNESILAGFGMGFAGGLVLGGLGALFPAFFASSFMLGLGMGFSVPFIVNSFQNGNNAQGVFRIFSGIFVPLALRNAAIARLAAASEAAFFARIAGLWKAVALRSNFMAAADAASGVAGSFVAGRIPLSENVAPGRYLYVVDEAGKMWLGPETLPAHSALVPAGAKVRSAGHIRINGDKTVDLNCLSGHYMRYQPLVYDSEKAAWLGAMSETILGRGLVPHDLMDANQFLK